MADDNVLYTFAQVEGYRLPAGLPKRDLTQRDLDRMAPEQRRELKAFAKAGQFYTAVNKSTATRAINRAKKAEAESAAAESEG